MKLVGIGVLLLAVLAVAYGLYMARVLNPAVERELRERPDGERARRVMLIRLPSGRTIPVNYLREGDRVFAAADGRWWRELRGSGVAVELLIRGETLAGRARVIDDDPARRAAVFDRLRPTAPKAFGPLVEIELGPNG